MRLLELELVNINSHEDTLIRFEDYHFVSIVGKNGSGKSSIVEGVMFGLFGDNRHNINSIVRHGQSSGQVRVKFMVDGRVFEVTRVREVKKRGGVSKLFVSEDGVMLGDANGSLETNQVVIDGLVGLSEDMLRRTVFAIEGDTSDFMLLKPAARKDFVLDVLGLDEYEMYVKEAKVRLGVVEDEVMIAEREVFAVSERVESVAGDRVESAELLASIVAGKASVKDLEALQVVFVAESEELAVFDEASERVGVERSAAVVAAERLSVLRGRFSEVLASVGGLSNQIVEMKEHQWSDGKMSEVIQRCDAVKGELDAAGELAAELKARGTLSREAFEKAKRRLSSAESDGGECDACGSVLDVSHVERLEGDVESLRLELSGSQAEYKTVMGGVQADRDELAELELSVADSKAVSSALLAKEKLLWDDEQRKPLLEADVEGAEVVLAECERVLAATEVVLADAPVRSVSDVSGELASVSAQVFRDEGKLEAVERTIAEKEGLKDDLVTMGERLNVLLLDVKDWETVVAGCQRDGIPSIILDRVVKQFEVNINYGLDLLTDGMYRVEVDYDKGFNMLITINGVVGDYESCSLGEKTRVNMAIRLALYLLVKARTGVCVESFIIDEGISALDPEGIEAIMGCLTKLNKEFPLVVLITHQAAAFETSPQSMSVTKTGGISVVAPERT